MKQICERCSGTGVMDDGSTGLDYCGVLCSTCHGAGTLDLKLSRDAINRPVFVYCMGVVKQGVIQAVKYDPPEALVYVDEGAFYWIPESDFR